MDDKAGIYKRFAHCHGAKNSAQLAKICGVPPQTSHSWKSGKNPIPIRYLKRLVDKQVISWDWLLEGNEPVISPLRVGKRPKPLSRHGINKRFFGLFSDMSQSEIAEELGITQTSVCRWFNDKATVPWKRLKYAVDTKGTTWEWLLEGRK